MKRFLLFFMFPAVLGALLVFGFIQGREEMKKESIHESTIQAHVESTLDQAGTVHLKLDSQTEELSGIMTTPFTNDRGLIALPESAIVRFNGKTFIYLKLSAQDFLRTEVEFVKTFDDRAFWRTLAPLKNAVVITSGAGLLLSEELKSQIRMGEGDKG